MKRIDFTQPGGFPFTQDVMAYLQEGFDEAILAALGYRNPGVNVAVRLSGMQSTTVLGITTVSAGWFLYNNALIKFMGGSYGALTIGHAIYVTISTAATPLTFYDGSTPSVIQEDQGGLLDQLATVPDGATQFQLAHMQEFCLEPGYTTSTVTGFGGSLNIDYSISYRKDYLTNTLHLKGRVTKNSSIGYEVDYAAPTPEILLTVPAMYAPANTAKIPHQLSEWRFLDSSLATHYLNELRFWIDSGGNINVILLLQIPASASYTFDFNCVIPLD